MEYITEYSKFNSINEEKEWVQSVINNCEDILLEIGDMGLKYKVDKVFLEENSGRNDRYYTLNELNIECKIIKSLAHRYFFNSVKSDIDNYNDVVIRLVEYMKMEGFTMLVDTDLKLMDPSTFVNTVTNLITFTKKMSRDYIGHLRYLKRYKIKE